MKKNKNRLAVGHFFPISVSTVASVCLHNSEAVQFCQRVGNTSWLLYTIKLDIAHLTVELIVHLASPKNHAEVLLLQSNGGNLKKLKTLAAQIDGTSSSFFTFVHLEYAAITLRKRLWKEASLFLEAAARKSVTARSAPASKLWANVSFSTIWQKIEVTYAESRKATSNMPRWPIQ